MDPDERFERGWLAALYLLGRRGDDLDLPGPASPKTDATRKALKHHDRSARARALAPELARLIREMEARQRA